MRKRIRKMPVRLMITFWPSEEVRKRDNQFIVDLCIKDLQDSVGMQLFTLLLVDVKGREEGRKGEMAGKLISYLEGV